MKSFPNQGQAKDTGDGYDYARGAFALVDFFWNDERGELTISARQGSFPELVKERECNFFLSHRMDGRGRQFVIKAEP